MKCLRCGSPMYRAVVPDGSGKATCTNCSQFKDAAQCSNPACGDVKCLPCYNKSVLGPRPTAGAAPLIPHDEDP